MDKNRPPAPPHTDNPIVILRSMSLHKELAFIDEILTANHAGDVDRAAKCASAALSSAMSRDMVNAIVGVVNNLAYEKNYYPPSIKVLLCKAADSGFHEYAYNAANHIMDGPQTLKMYQEAERYFKMAMAFSEKPELQAAAYVNYCPLVRDGLISGTPDWPAAVELYEAAARMGLAKAMFNAGNVCTWIASQGDRAYGARGAYWFKHALEVHAAQTPTLDMDTPSELERVFEQCMVALSGLHIDAMFDGAELEEGIRWATAAVNRGVPEARNNLAVGHMRRLTKLVTPPRNAPGANWRAVLTAMDWEFDGGIQPLSVRSPAGPEEGGLTLVDSLTVKLADGTAIPLFVIHDPCLPEFGGLELLSGIAFVLADRHPAGYFLVSRKALFIQKGERSFTPIYVWYDGKFSRQALWMGGSPDQVLQNARASIEFTDERFSNGNCMIPIAVNVLDEGYVVAEVAKPELPWVGVGEPWRMPFFDRSQLAKLRIAT